MLLPVNRKGDQMAIKKSLIVTGVIASVGLASLAAIGTVAADTNGNNSLAQAIAKKFNLNQNEVQQVLDEHHSEMEAEHQQKLENRLSQAVKDGKITEEQKTKILAKLDEMKKEREDNKDKVKNMSEEERKKFMDERRTALESWAKENGIPLTSLHFLMPHHGHGGPGFDK